LGVVAYSELLLLRSDADALWLPNRGKFYGTSLNEGVCYGFAR